jgi:hypothetical protein
LSDIKCAHNQKGKGRRKKSPQWSITRYIDTQTTTKDITSTTKEDLQKRHLQEGNREQAPSSPEQQILGFCPRESLKYQNKAFNKVISRYNNKDQTVSFHP